MGENPAGKPRPAVTPGGKPGGGNPPAPVGGGRVKIDCIDTIEIPPPVDVGSVKPGIPTPGGTKDKAPPLVGGLEAGETTESRSSGDFGKTPPPCAAEPCDGGGGGLSLYWDKSVGLAEAAVRELIILRTGLPLGKFMIYFQIRTISNAIVNL